MHVAAIAEVLLTSGRDDGISTYAPGVAAAAVLVLAAITGLVGIFSPRWRRTGLRLSGLIAAGLVACYAVGRGIAEFWVVNYSDPASYQQSWGGPSLAGVFAVHTGPGLMIVIAAVWWLLRRRRARERA